MPKKTQNRSILNRQFIFCFTDHISLFQSQSHSDTSVLDSHKAELKLKTDRQNLTDARFISRKQLRLYHVM
jgi:hypothetical protein